MNIQEHTTTQQVSLKATCACCHKPVTAKSFAERCPHCGGFIYVQDAPLSPGFVIDGKYEVIKQIGIGAWGTVYLATQKGLNREVAVKLLHRHMVTNAAKMARFQLEAESLKQISHEGVAAIYDAGTLQHEAGDQPYFVQEFVSGVTLRELLRHNKVTGAQIKDIFCQVLSVLEAAHTKGIIHRDIKPSNIVISNWDSKPAVTLLDFGIAKLTEDENAPSLTAVGDVLGTPLYMSPEQCVGDPIDRRADLYSIGCLLYEVITGVSPFKSESSMTCMIKQVSEPPPDLLAHNITPEWIRVIEKSLEKKPANRFQTAVDFYAAVENLPDDFRNTISTTTARQYDNPRKLALSVTAAISLLIGAIIFSVMHFSHSAGIEVKTLTDEQEPSPSEHNFAISHTVHSAPSFLPYNPKLPEKISWQVSAICSDGTPHGFYVLTNELFHLSDGNNPALRKIGSFPMGGSGFSFSPSQKCFFVFGRTASNPGFLRSINLVGENGTLLKRVALSQSIPIDESLNQQISCTMVGTKLQSYIPEGNGGWIKLLVDPETGAVAQSN